eukprot:7012938-Heterocapsa_arctica.AAC.1
MQNQGLPAVAIQSQRIVGPYIRSYTLRLLFDAPVCRSEPWSDGGAATRHAVAWVSAHFAVGQKTPRKSKAAESCADIDV